MRVQAGASCFGAATAAAATTALTFGVVALTTTGVARAEIRLMATSMPPAGTRRVHPAKRFASRAAIARAAIARMGRARMGVVLILPDAEPTAVFAVPFGPDRSTLSGMVNTSLTLPHLTSRPG